MRLFTIGFTKKTAKGFFEILKNNKVKKLLDVRLNNSSQLAGFTKGTDLQFFLSEICGIEYEHDISLAPTKEILNWYKRKEISWLKYENLFIKLLMERRIDNKFKELDGLCLLCSEASPENCHRRLVAEYIKENKPDLNIEIIHLQ